MSRRTSPSDPRQASAEFTFTAAATGASSFSIPSPVDGTFLGFTVRCQTTDTDVVVSVAYGGAEVVSAGAPITTALTYSFDAINGGASVARDGSGSNVLRFDFTNDSAFAADLYVRADFISAQ